MRIELLQQLACPGCGGGLTLLGHGGTTGEIDEGTVRCEACSSEFPLRGGIARFVTAIDSDISRRTRRVYDFTWGHLGETEVHREWEKDSYEYMLLIPEGLVGGVAKVGMEAGCGGGADLLRVGARGGTVIGFDLSGGVDVARRLTRHLDGVEIVQGDLNRLPFKPACFDFIYSFGVLHHLADPQDSFARLAALLKPGAPLVTYLYEDRADRSKLDKALLRIVSSLRRWSSRFPPLFLYSACWSMVPFVWLTFAAPARALRSLSPALADGLPFAHTMRPSVLAADLFDRFAPPVEWRFSERQVRQLYARAGLERVEIRRHRGWVSWGFKPGGAFS